MAYYLGLGIFISAMMGAAVGTASAYNPDPLGLANGDNVLFVNNYVDTDTPPAVTCSDSYDRNTARDPAHPWCSLQGLSESCSNPKFEPGDTVYIRGGTYTHEIISGQPGQSSIRICSSGTSEAPITITAYTDEAVTIEAGSRDFTDFLLIVGDYVVLDSLNFIGHISVPEGTLYMPSPLRLGYTDHSQVRNVSITAFQGIDDVGLPDFDDPEDPGRHGVEHRNREGYGDGLELDHVTNAIIDNVDVTCTARDNPIEHISYGDGQIMSFVGHGLRISGGSSITVKNSHFYDCGHISLQSYQDATQVDIFGNTFNNELHTCLALYHVTEHRLYSNIFRDCNTNPIPTDDPNDIEGKMGNAIQVTSASFNQIFNNLIYVAAADPFNGIGIDLDANVEVPRYGSTAGNKVYNNLVYNSGMAGISLTRFGALEPAAEPVRENKIYNNIVYGIKDYPIGDPPPQEYAELRLANYEAYEQFQSNDGTLNEFKNNLLLSLQAGQDAPVVKYLELWAADPVMNVDGFNAGGSFAENNIGAPGSDAVNPTDIFVDPAVENFRSKSASLAIDAGICTPDVLDVVGTDFHGIPRPSTGCDIGPFETCNGPDTDEDGVCDDLDDCPDVPGPGGCPAGCWFAVSGASLLHLRRRALQLLRSGLRTRRGLA